MIQASRSNPPLLFPPVLACERHNDSALLIAHDRNVSPVLPSGEMCRDIAGVIMLREVGVYDAVRECLRTHAIRKVLACSDLCRISIAPRSL